MFTVLPVTDMVNFYFLYTETWIKALQNGFHSHALGSLKPQVAQARNMTIGVTWDNFQSETKIEPDLRLASASIGIVV